MELYNNIILNINIFILNKFITYETYILYMVAMD